MNNPRIAGLLWGSLSLLARALHAQERNITDLDLTTLMNMDVTVTSAARRAQASSDVAASVFVITRDDIHRSGATSIPELLRFVPGMQVARVSNHRWAVSVRGFGSAFSNKLLVLIDGRSVYTHVFSGVYWDYQQVPLEEIARIEVVRGPGGALWGANAVNGVINIITNSAADSAGPKVAAGLGDDDRHIASFHFGGDAGTRSAYRGYFEQFQRDSYQTDALPWRHFQSGWRLDSQTGENSTFTLQGDVARDDVGDMESFGSVTSRVKNTAANINLSWDGAAYQDGRLSVRSSYSWHQSHTSENWEREEDLDLNLQYSAARMGRHLFTLGGGWRLVKDELQGLHDLVTFDPVAVTDDQENLYVQDEIFFFSDTVRATLGAKVEQFEHTGFAFQPTARALWHIDDEHTVWTAFSRAVRTPSFFERAGTVLVSIIPGSPPVRIYLNGNPDVEEETLKAFELGWRWRPSQRWNFDVALYNNRYASLVKLSTLPPEFVAGPEPYVQIGNLLTNAGRARTRGADTAIQWLVLPTMQIQAAGSWMHVHAPGVPNAAGALLEGVDPKESYSLQVRNDLPFSAELDVTYRYVGELRSFGVPAYDSLDLHLNWHVGKNWDLSLNVNNLLNNVHQEFPDEENLMAPGDRIGRSVFLHARWYAGPK